VHRAGEGAPYTGLKPAGRDLGPAIPAADRAIETGSVGPLETLLTEALVSGIRTRFDQVREAKAQAGQAGTGVEAGRRYVRAYVTFIHYVERLYEAARTSPDGHFAEADHAGTASSGDSRAPASSAGDRH
jgi:hypothetical protein